MNDGASCVVVCSEEFAARRGLEPLATILSQGYVADDYAYLARTPARAGEQALAKAGKTIDDVARVEINEAFSSVAQELDAMLGADEEIVNVNGGAVALGHPIGASGGRIVGDDGARAAPRGRRARARGDLLRRRPGRRAPHRGLKRASLVISQSSCSRSAEPALRLAVCGRDAPSASGSTTRTVRVRRAASSLSVARGAQRRAADTTCTVEVEQRVKGVDVSADGRACGALPGTRLRVERRRRDEYAVGRPR